MRLRAVLALFLTAVCLDGCSALTTFNTFTPTDPRASLAKADIAYGAQARQRLDVYIPEGGLPGAPVVVFFYGGGWDSGRKDDYSFVGKALASRGFVTIIPDYRLVPAVRFPAFVEDGAQAVRWVHDHIAEFGGDPQRLYLLGHSAGAYNAMMLTLDAHFLAAAGLGARAVRATAGLSGPYDFLPLDVDESKAAFGQAKNLAATQPINFVRGSAPPIFVATGADDSTVYPRNTTGLAARLRAAGDEVEEKTYPDMDHAGMVLALSRPFRGRAPVLEDVVRFFRAH
ncbi:alpha/beta hydrolase [Methylocapsa sp. S129]|uniref:alpha/beta hydrolase n=1 Tax=Methylocapsa sp. S129 TaxID=1641869 RepID=UPI00131EB1F2|nr:alpha/beta hydrolase [Methylocapsa sp. S129]